MADNTYIVSVLLERTVQLAVTASNEQEALDKAIDYWEEYEITRDYGTESVSAWVE